MASAATRGNSFYEGKAKILYETSDPNRIIQYFKDDATAFNAQKKGTIVNKGVMNNRISSHIFKMLTAAGIPNHFIEHMSEREMLCQRVKIVPLEVVMRNVVAGSLSKRTGLEEGTPCKQPILELYFKDDALGDPMVNENHVRAFGWATEAQLAEIKRLGHRVNEILTAFFAKIGIRLIDFKLEFGVNSKGEILLADEITPDGCRLWDAKTGEKMDKDRFRRDLGNIEEAYQRVLQRVTEERV